VTEAAGNAVPSPIPVSSTSGNISIADSRVVVGVPDPEVVEEFFWATLDHSGFPKSSSSFYSQSVSRLDPQGFARREFLLVV
jgi:hypothetical protein